MPYDRDEDNATEGQWFRCRHCGFICSDKRDEHDTRGNGCSYEQVGVNTILEVDGHPVLVDGSYVIVEQLFYHAIVNTGCPLCGSHTWKG